MTPYESMVMALILMIVEDELRAFEELFELSTVELVDIILKISCGVSIIIIISTSLLLRQIVCCPTCNYLVVIL